MSAKVTRSAPTPKYAYSSARLGGVTLAEAARVLGREPLMVSAKGYCTSVQYMTPVALDGYKVSVGVYAGRTDAAGWQTPEWKSHPLDGQVFDTLEEANEAKFAAGVCDLYLTTFEAGAISARANKKES